MARSIRFWMDADSIAKTCSRMEIGDKTQENSQKVHLVNGSAFVTEDSPLILQNDKDVPSWHVEDAKSLGPVKHRESTCFSVEEDPPSNKYHVDRLASAEDDVTKWGPENEDLASPLGVYGCLSMQGQKVEIDVNHLQFVMVRVPRFLYNKLKTKIQHAEQEVDANTQE